MGVTTFRTCHGEGKKESPNSFRSGLDHDPAGNKSRPMVHGSTGVTRELPELPSLPGNLCEAFVTNFIGGKKRLKASTHLNNIVQKVGELLKDYIKCFNLEAIQVPKHSDKTTLNAIMQGFRDKPFLFSLDRNPPSTLVEFMNQSQKYINADESRIFQEAAQNKNASIKESTKKEADSTNANKKWKDDCPQDQRKSSKRPDSKFTTYTPLNKPQEQVHMEIKGERFVNWPNKLRGNPNRRSRNKYCHFHHDHKHNTSDCYNLKRKIERLIRKGHLGEHMDQGADRTVTVEKCLSNNRPTEEIQTIVAGHKGGGD
ncbi:uncharacterized protein LOC131224267 [Magnolia sinica]|uniref:uncharacterized protein LOC131224267 n=1 Tax=Magnolia sinica TaxID=86752 RepID=UPI0026583063|nr:uncharacterized protein LOC131224267 [Magnolia sinica]